MHDISQVTDSLWDLTAHKVIADIAAAIEKEEQKAKRHGIFTIDCSYSPYSKDIATWKITAMFTSHFSSDKFQANFWNSNSWNCLQN